MAGVISGRLATQLVLVAVVIVFLTTYALMKGDVTPSSAARPLEVEPVVIKASDIQLGPTVDPDSNVVVSIDQMMKSPVSLEQTDLRLIKRIRSHYLFPPSSEPYSLASADDDPSMGQSKQIREILGEQKGGFFIECGALDGETRSNTLVFEKKLGWQGVLIEGDPKNFELLKKKNRKAWMVNGCLSTFPYPNTVMFKQQFNIGKISAVQKGHQMAGYAEVQCLPLYSVLLALNITTVDYFSLDVEGAELDILKTIPWEKVDIKTLSVEFVHGGEGKGKEAISKFMSTKGYGIYSEVTHPGWLANDFIFAKKEILHKLKTEKSVITKH